MSAIVNFQENVNDKYFDYVLETVFNLNNLSDYELTQATVELAGVIKHYDFLDFVKTELSKNIYGSAYQRFLIIVERFKQEYAYDLKEYKEITRQKSKNELFAEQFEKKVLMIAKGLRAKRDEFVFKNAKRERIDIVEFQEVGYSNLAIDIVLNIARSYAKYKLEDQTRTARGLVLAKEDGVLKSMIDDRINILIQGCKKQIERIESRFNSDTQQIEFQNQQIERYEKTRKILKHNIDSICDVYSSRFERDYSYIKKVEGYKIERNGTIEPLFNQTELKFFYGIGFDQIISYVDQGYLKQAVLDAFKRKQKSRQLTGASRVEALLAQSLRGE